MEIHSIVLVGAGNVATHLSVALQRAEYRILQVYSRTLKSASELGAKLGCPSTDCLEEVCGEADLYIVSIKDTALNDVLPRLTARNRKALFVHTAGSIPMDVWKGLAVRYGVLYPMQTFSKRRKVNFSTVPFFIEASDSQSFDEIRKVASCLGGRVYEASSEQRRYLHLAAVFACNFTNHMYAIAYHLLTAHGLPFEVMLPLIDETARKVHLLSPIEAQTGPAQRYDENVINRHLEMLADEKMLEQLYRDISRNIHEYTISNEE